MRHKNYYKNLAHSTFHGEPGKTYYLPHPYYDMYAYTKPSMKFMYMKLIQWIADHPDCSRREAMTGVWGGYSRGAHGETFACLLHDDYIDYDKKFRYHVTAKGQELLKKAYLNDCAKIAMS